MNNLWGNSALWIPVSIWFLAQLLKAISDIIIFKKFNLKRLWGSGGMPSSHSALVMSITTYAALLRGIQSFEFAACLIFASIVMYDAAGVRRAAGKQARVLNQMIENDGNIDMGEKLIELLGHTPFEVFMGAILGIVGTIAFYRIW
ncbi:MAG: divergent PAP2 family protein [Clostridia bacterium]|nr:divergent PAP2 family protein [Clostridia bacterium]